MTDQPARWIDQAHEVVLFPADPAEWTDEQVDVIVARMNADGLRRLLAGIVDVQADETKDGAA